MHTRSLHSSHRIGPEVVGAGYSGNLFFSHSPGSSSEENCFSLFYFHAGTKEKNVHRYMPIYLPHVPPPWLHRKKFSLELLQLVQPFSLRSPFFLVFLISLPSNWFNPTSLSWSRKWLNRGLSRLLICLRLVLAGWVGLGRVGSDWGFRV